MASRDSWDPPTPRPGLVVGALTPEELEMMERLSQRYTQWGASPSPLPSGLPSPLPTAPATAAPSRNLSRSSSRRSDTSQTGSRRGSRSSGTGSGGGGGGGGGGGCCGGGTDDVVHSTMPSPARSTHRRLDPRPTPPGYSYLCEADGSVVRNAEGERLETLMRDITWNVFRHDLLTNWRSIPKERKQYVLAALHDEFPQPDLDACFNDAVMMRRMGVLLGHRRSEARDAYKEGRNQPNWVDNETWATIKAERDGNPRLFQQQVDARSEQSSSSTSHLGSGGMDAMKRDFRGEFDRRPSRLEKDYASSRGFNRLRVKLMSKESYIEGVPPSPLREDEISD